MKDFVIIYPTQKKADDAFRRTADLFGKESCDRVDAVRRKITLCSGSTMRFLSENHLCDKIRGLNFEQPVGFIDCWSFDKKLLEYEKLTGRLTEGIFNAVG